MKKLSIIVPAYNEENRIPPFLNDIIKLTSGFRFGYEVLIINDGSTDNSVEVISRMIKSNKSYKLISYNKNKGKANAIKVGVEQSKGRYCQTKEIERRIH